MNQAPGQDSFDTKLREALANPDNLPAEFKNYMVQYIAQNPVPLNAIIAPSHNATGLGDAVQGTRYVGATTSGSPTTGYFKVGDFVVDQSGAMWVCTASGDPGTWIEVGSSGHGTLDPGGLVFISGSQIFTSGSETSFNVSASSFSPAFFTSIPTVGNPITFTCAVVVHLLITVIVDWPAGNYDRYIEATITNSGDTNYTKSPHLEGSLSPDSDSQTLTCFIAGKDSPATTITINGFQSSGSNKTATLNMCAISLPYQII